MKKYNAAEKSLERMDYYIKENGLKEHRQMLLMMTHDIAMMYLSDYRNGLEEARGMAYQRADRIDPTKKRAK